MTYPRLLLLLSALRQRSFSAILWYFHTESLAHDATTSHPIPSPSMMWQRRQTNVRPNENCILIRFDNGQQEPPYEGLNKEKLCSEATGIIRDLAMQPSCCKAHTVATNH